MMEYVSVEHLSKVYDEVPVKLLASYDPTPTHSYLKWLIKQYQLGNVSRDQSKGWLFSLLQKFNLSQAILSKSDIYQYSSVEELNVIVHSLPSFGRFIPEDVVFRNLNEVFSDCNFSICIADSQQDVIDASIGAVWPSNELQNSYPSYSKSFINDAFIIYKKTNDRLDKYGLFCPASNLFLDICGNQIKPSKSLVDSLIGASYVINDPNKAFLFCVQINSRVEKLEPLILSDPSSSLFFEYIYSVARTRIPLAESFIVKNPVAAATYASRIINNRWPEAEPAIISNNDSLKVYLTEVIGGPFPDSDVDSRIRNSSMGDWYRNFISLKENAIKKRKTMKDAISWGTYCKEYKVKYMYEDGRSNVF